MIPKIRVFAKAGTKEFFGGGYDRDQMFYEISEIDFYNKTVTVWGCHNKDCGMCDDTYRIEDVKIMMATGVKDKNGVEIYEGDYIDCKWGYDDWSGVAEFIEGSFCTNPLSDLKFPSIINECSSIKVIGNIYENPELLEVAE